MKSLRVFAMVVAAMGLLTAVSCSNEKTPAEEIEKTTTVLEEKAEEVKADVKPKAESMKEEADTKAAETMDRTKKTELPK